MKKYLYLTMIFVIGLVSCSPAYSSVAMLADPETVSTAVGSQANPTPTPLTVSYSIAALQERNYGDGELTVEYMWERKEEFSRYYITYTSDGLTIHGFVNVPDGDGPFPVVIALHGYIPASEYETLDYSTRYADSIARKGYIVLHPNMRNFPPSDSPGRVRDSLAGYTIDVMNLIALVDKLAGQEGIFKNADMQQLGIWGHSLGGGIALRVATLENRIKAIVLYGAVSQRYNNDPLGLPVYDLRDITAPFSVHHGSDDETVSPAWSETLCNILAELGKEHECYFYQGQPHTFYRLGSSDALFIQRTVDFFNNYLEN